MCGIAGIFEPDGARAPPQARVEIIRGMLAQIAHRGPDETGTLVAPDLAMGMVRLKILDLSHGQQPMQDDSGRWWICYNGEIYNFIELRAELEAKGHRFTTRGDTEVALRAWIEWGPEAVARFDGGYAFALYDRHARSLHLVRDRYGKRPLYLREHASRVSFASEIKAFLAEDGPELDWCADGLQAILSKWAPSGRETPFAAITQLPPGTILSIDAQGRRREEMYGGFQAPKRAETPNPGDVAAVRDSLQEATRLRLRSDVEVGVLLSGGLDSAIVAHLVRSTHDAGLQTFSVAFEDAQFDESAEQQAMVDRLGTAHTALTVSEADIADAFPAALWHAEVPQFRTAFVPFYLLARQIKSRGVSVVLSGEGSDEVFLGYDIFRETRLRAAWPTLDDAARREGLRGLYPYLPFFSEANLSALETRFARSVGSADDPLFSHAMRFEHGAFARKILAGSKDNPLQNLANDVQGETPLARAQWLEFATLLGGYLLSSQGDRMLFAHGVEPRTPFLSRHVVELAGRLAEQSLLNPAGQEKAILKAAFANALPDAILSKVKQPYLAPDARSFRTETGLRDWVEDALSPETLTRIAPLDARFCDKLVAKLRRTPSDRISPRDSQAFLFLLSISMLNDQFVGNAPARRAPMPLGPTVRDVHLEAQM
ncbi:MAG: asparagine synthase (glutamine-hydrolyzing) [Pseudomonadota bacterium]